MEKNGFQQIKVAVIVFDDVDLLDVTGPVEVFNAATVEESISPADTIDEIYDKNPAFETYYVTYQEQEYITTSDGTKIIPDFYSTEIEDYSEFRVWVIPGGKGIHEMRKDPGFIDFLTKAIDQSFKSLSVCTGAYACAMTGYLENEIVATHWRHADFFEEEFPDIKLANNARYMEGHKVVTTGGVSAGIDGALYLVKNLMSREVAEDAAKVINYRWLS